MNEGWTHVHASVVVVGETGLFIEGPPGSGKSALAEALVAEAARAGLFGRLVADDRVGLRPVHERVLAKPHPALAGLIERRGTGLIAVPHEPACVLGLVVELVRNGSIERLPETPPMRSLQGIALPLLRLQSGAGSFENAGRALLFLKGIVPRCTKSF